MGGVQTFRPQNYAYGKVYNQNGNNERREERRNIEFEEGGGRREGEKEREEERRRKEAEEWPGSESREFNAQVAILGAMAGRPPDNWQMWSPFRSALKRFYFLKFNFQANPRLNELNYIIYPI